MLVSATCYNAYDLADQGFKSSHLQLTILRPNTLESIWNTEFAKSANGGRKPPIRGRLLKLEK